VGVQVVSGDGDQHLLLAPSRRGTLLTGTTRCRASQSARDPDQRDGLLHSHAQGIPQRLLLNQLAPTRSLPPDLFHKLFIELSLRRENLFGLVWWLHVR